MKIHALFATPALGAVASLATAPVHAQDVCASFLCMAGKTQGKNNVAGCTAPVQAFFSPIHYVYDAEGDVIWPATALRRGQWLAECPGSQGQNSGILTTIIAEYGMQASG